MTDRYAVIGNPIAHSLSPTIHTLFASQTKQDLTYTTVLAEIGSFEETVKQLQKQGFKGANVTLPFKEDAFHLATQCTERAQLAKAVNTLSFLQDGTIIGDNTDGIGFINDLTLHFHFKLSNKRILVIGAGGAARGIVPAILSQQPTCINITNRTQQRARDLVADFSTLGNIQAIDWETKKTHSYDLIINATSLSVQGTATNFPRCQLSATGGCYDLAYGKQPNAFFEWAKPLGAQWCADGLGMLVEQAAEAFFIWRKIRPHTQPVLQLLLHNQVNKP